MDMNILLAFALGVASAMALSVFGLIVVICYAIKHAKDGEKNEATREID